METIIDFGDPWIPKILNKIEKIVKIQEGASWLFQMIVPELFRTSAKWKHDGCVL